MARLLVDLASSGVVSALTSAVIGSPLGWGGGVLYGVVQRSGQLLLGSDSPNMSWSSAQKTAFSAITTFFAHIAAWKVTKWAGFILLPRHVVQMAFAPALVVVAIVVALLATAFLVAIVAIPILMVKSNAPLLRLF